MMTSCDVGVLTYVCVIMTLALVGNTLVLVILGCRWTARSAAEVYVLYLAALDLVCALVSTPREVLNLCLDKRSLNVTSLDLRALHYHCAASTYLSFALNFTSALVLVFIALTRYHKCTRLDQGRGKVGRLQRRVKAALELLCTLRGAKLASAVALGLCALLSTPVLLSLVLQDTKDGFDASCLNAKSRKLALHDVQPVFFSAFLLMAVSLVLLYGAVLHRVWQRHRRRRRDVNHPTRSRNSGVWAQQSCESTDSVFDSGCDAGDDTKVRRTTTRTLSEGDAPVTSWAGGSMIEFHRSVSSPFTKAELGRVRGKDRPGVDDGAKNDDSYDVNLSFVTPVAYTAQMCSALSLELQMSGSRSEQKVEGCRLSVNSLQFSKGGNPARQTTAVFFAITLIYVGSYLPYFILDILHERDGNVWILLLSRSYLISNAFNPVVYGLCNRHFRRALGKLFLCRREVL